MLTSPLTRRPRDLLTVLSTLDGPRPVATHSNKRLFESYAAAVQRRAALGQSLQRVSRKEFGYDLNLPPTPLVGASEAAGHEGRTADVLAERLRQFDTAFDEGLRQCPYFARIEYAGPHECVFRYCDATKSYDLQQTIHHIRTHEHHLVQAQERRLTDIGVVLPPKQRRIVRALPQVVYPQLRVVTGLLVLQKEEDGGTVRREHTVGRTLRQTGEAVRKYGSGAARGVAAGAVAAGIVAGVAAMVSAISTAVATAAVVAVADPALVIGDLVISGWIEGIEGQP
ncbi:MAG: hypothetical protein HZA46_16000 [Planctomycetales bacterium]|nr:hypothetical protein [Planctomycetales bacterium]